MRHSELLPPNENPHQHDNDILDVIKYIIDIKEVFVSFISFAFSLGKVVRCFTSSLSSHALFIFGYRIACKCKCWNTLNLNGRKKSTESLKHFWNVGTRNSTLSALKHDEVHAVIFAPLCRVISMPSKS